jgi:hypothetical protein
LAGKDRKSPRWPQLAPSGIGRLQAGVGPLFREQRMPPKPAATCSIRRPVSRCGRLGFRQSCRNSTPC